MLIEICDVLSLIQLLQIELESHFVDELNAVWLHRWNSIHQHSTNEAISAREARQHLIELAMNDAVTAGTLMDSKQHLYFSTASNIIQSHTYVLFFWFYFNTN